MRPDLIRVFQSPANSLTAMIGVDMQDNTQQAVGEASDEHADSTLQAVEAQQQATVQKQGELAQPPPDAPSTASSNVSSGDPQTAQAADQHYPPAFREMPMPPDSPASPSGEAFDSSVSSNPV